MLRNVLNRLEEDHPELRRVLGDRIDLQLPAIAFSVLTHLALLLVFATIGYAVHSNEQAGEFRSEVVHAELPDVSRLDPVELVETAAETTLAPASGSFAPTIAAKIMTEPPTTSANLETIKPEVPGAAKIILPTATRLDQMVSIRGSGAEHVGGVDTAVDRLAQEILRRLEKGRTLVVWCFDASGSLQAERERLSKYIRNVYAHIKEHDSQAKGESDSTGLLTIVAAFGKDRRPMTPEATSDPDEIASAIAAVPLDESGVENTFRTVVDSVHKWGKFKRDGHKYQTMVIVVTDEIGDDEGNLEEAIATASAARVPVFVLGNSALFGRVEGLMDYTDPKTKIIHRNLKVNQGPESAMIEQIRLPFWYDGPQFEYMDAGFGPYALSRLAGATGGIYFVTRMNKTPRTYDPAGMREYQPDWMSREQYEAAIARHPIRQAVVAAGQIAQQNLPAQPGMSFPPVDGPDFKEVMKRNQEVAARTSYTVDAALAPISQAVKFRDRETSRRWQAHYDLARGRLLAMKIRCYEYNWACATMKKDPKKFTKPGSNAWRLVPDKEIHYSDKAAAAAEEAKTLLKRVITDHPGTPWADLAARELKDDFGFKWVEVKLPPPPKPMEGAAAEAARRKKAMPPGPKPPDPPKL